MHLIAQNRLQSPTEFLGYELGTQFTPHNNVLDYFKNIAENSPLVTYKRYGATCECRELGIVKATSEENLLTSV